MPGAGDAPPILDFSSMFIMCSPLLGAFTNESRILPNRPRKQEATCGRSTKLLFTQWLLPNHRSQGAARVTEQDHGLEQEVFRSGARAKESSEQRY